MYRKIRIKLSFWFINLKYFQKIDADDIQRHLDQAKNEAQAASEASDHENDHEGFIKKIEEEQKTLTKVPFLRTFCLNYDNSHFSSEI